MRLLLTMCLLSMTGCAGRKLVKVADITNDVQLIQKNISNLRSVGGDCWEKFAPYLESIERRVNSIAEGLE